MTLKEIYELNTPFNSFVKMLKIDLNKISLGEIYNLKLPFMIWLRVLKLYHNRINGKNLDVYATTIKQYTSKKNAKKEARIKHYFKQVVEFSGLEYVENKATRLIKTEKGLFHLKQQQKGKADVTIRVDKGNNFIKEYHVEIKADGDRLSKEQSDFLLKNNGVVLYDNYEQMITLVKEILIENNLI